MTKNTFLGGSCPCHPDALQLTNRRKCFLYLQVMPDDPDSLLATSDFIAPKSQLLHLQSNCGGKMQGKNSIRKKAASVHTLPFKSPKLFVIPSHCHCSGKEPVSDSRSISLGSSFYSSTRQKQRSRVSDLPIVEIKSLDPDPNICLQNHDCKPTGWSNFGLKLQGLSSSRGRNIPLVR